MINEISYTSDSKSNEGMRLSFGEYNTNTNVLKVWVYHTRMERILDGSKEIDRVAKIRDLNSKDYEEYLNKSLAIELVDLDWDKHWTMPAEQFIEAKVVHGYRSFKLSDLKLIS